VLVYARTYTQTTWVFDVSPGVGRAPGELEESRSTKAQYTYKPHVCTKYICLSRKAHKNGENVTPFRGIAFVANDMGWP